MKVEANPSPKTLPFSIRLETAGDAAIVDAFIWNVFGPGMTARAAYALREGVAFEPSLAFVAQAEGGQLIGSVRITKVRWGGTLVWMLGPLGVARARSGRGIGGALMRTVMAVCADQADRTGIHHVILVGDLAYYQPFGFEPVKPGTATMPRPADPARILVCPLNGAKAEGLAGPVTRFEG